MRIYKKALKDLKITQAQEERLYQQMDLVNCCIEEAIIIKERSIKEQEAAEAARNSELLSNNIITKGLSLNLSLGTQSALEGYSNEFQEYPSLLLARS